MNATIDSLKDEIARVFPKIKVEHRDENWLDIETPQGQVTIEVRTSQKNPYGYWGPKSTKEAAYGERPEKTFPSQLQVIGHLIGLIYVGSDRASL